MNVFIMQLNRLIDRFIPNQIKSNIDEYRAISNVLTTSWIVFMPIVLFFGILTAIMGNWVQSILTIEYVIALTILTINIKHIGFHLFSRIVEFHAVILILAAYLPSGNVFDVAALWLFSPSLIAYLNGSIRWGIIWTCIIALILIAIFILHFGFDMQLPNLYTKNNLLHNIRNGFSTVSVIVSVSLAILVFENNRKKAARAEKESYEKLIAAKDQLLQAEKLSAIGQMVAGVAHEVNSPRASVDHFLTLTEKQIDKILAVSELPIPAKIPASAIKDTYLPSMNLAITRIGELTNGLLNFARADHKEMQSSDLHQIINSVLVLLKGKLHNRIQIKKEYGNIPKVTCYPGQINQVFMNILTNAVQAMPEAGGDITIKTWQENHHVSVSIRDTGSGMNEETKKKIFDPFFTTKEVGKGTGLGMSIVWDILQKHGATIDVQSEIGLGTEFIIALPLSSNEWPL